MAFLLPLIAPAIPWLVDELSTIWEGAGDLFFQDDQTDMFEGEEF